MIKPFKKLIPFFILLSHAVVSFSQKETSHWFFEPDNHYIFSTSGTAMQPQSPVPIRGALTSISDSVGNLLFFTSSANGYAGLNIYDRHYNLLPYFSSENIYLNADNNNIFFVKNPANSNQFYLFYSTSVWIGNYSVYNSKLQYVLIDLTLNNGYGDIVVPETKIDSAISYGFTIAKKNENDFWIITHVPGTDHFRSWLVNSAGISATPVESIAGDNPYKYEYNYDELKTSPNGKMIAGTTRYHDGTQLFTTDDWFLEVFNFDNSSGILTSKVRSYTYKYVNTAFTHVEFSPDNRLVYADYVFSASLQPCGYGAGNLYQYNLCYTDSGSFSKFAPIVGQSFSWCLMNTWGQSQLAADKKIYFPYRPTNTMSSIQFPNHIGNSCGYQFSTDYIQNGFGSNLPTFYHAYTEKAVKNNIVYSGSCYPSPITFEITNDTINTVNWNFGDPNSGASNNSTLARPSHVFSTPGKYLVTANLYNTSGNLIEKLSDSIEIKDPNIRLLTGLPKDTAICEGAKIPVKLSVINGIFFWKIREPWGLYDLGVMDSLSLGDYGEEGTYIVEMHQNDCNGCVLTDSITLHFLKTPYISLGTDQKICSGDSIKLQTNNPGSVTVWSTGARTQSIWVKDSGSYWVKSEYDNNGCIIRDTINIGINPSVNFSLQNDTTLCDSESLLLDPGVPQSIYKWQDNSTGYQYTVTKPGKYWVNITNSSGCSASDTINVNYVSAASVNLGADTSLCKGDSLMLSLNIPGASYYWSTGSIENNITIKSDGNYWIRVNNNVCTVTDTIDVLFKEPPSVYLGNDTSLCEKETLLLNATTASSVYTWQDGSANASYTVSKAGQYFVKVNQEGCASSDTINVYYKPLPFVYLGNDTSLCQNDYLLLNAESAEIVSYRWQDNSTKASYTVTNEGNYIVNVTGINGCNNSDSITVMYNALPYFSLGNDTTLCNGEKLLLQLNLSNALYNWQDGSTANSFTVGSSGLYYVTVQQNGCSQTDSIYVNYAAQPVVMLGNDTTLCIDSKLVVSAYNEGATYHWQDNSTTPDYTITKSGIYKVDVAIGNCTASDDIKVDYIGKPVFSLGSDSLLCSGQNIILTAPENYDSYKWQDGSTARLFTVTQPGIYTLDVTNICGTTHKEITIVKTTCTLNMPSAFTPNGDGNNDLFRVKYPSFIKDFYFVVYNRFGQKVFETRDAYKGWDGRFNNILQPVGTYVWFISLTDNDGKKNTGKGSVLLIY